MNSSTSSSSARKQERSYFFIMLVVMLGALAFSAGLVWLVDPLQLFRKASFYPAVITADERTQNAGLLRNYPAENLIIGSSLSQSCRSDDFEAALGGDFLRLSAAGMTAKELGFYIDQRIRRQPTKRIVHISYWFTFARQGAGDYRQEFGGFPEHLYLFRPSDRLKYLVNVDNMLQSTDILLERVGLRSLERIDFIDRNSGEKDPKRKPGAASVARLYAQIANGRKPDANFLSAERARMEQTFEQYYAPAIAAHPDVHFDIILPPFSVAYYKAYAASGVYRLNTILKFRRMLIDLAAEYPNVTLHDFSGNYDVITNYDLYFDTHHFTSKGCSLIAKGLAAAPEGASAEAILANERNLRAWAESEPAPRP
ncbi:hypothetical protein [Hyphococcus sp.]|jgi:hypothetical protein|uniref:hypothetical protein n=1 Tax=Hyphococcus sp. TaxID=2038636 RepID=UPI003D13324B